MTGSIISIIVLTVSFALFAFVIAFLISSIVSADKIAADKRLEELKKKEGDNIDVALVNHESRHSKRKKENKVKSLRVTYIKSFSQQILKCDLRNF
jgi:D-ribose pyranose/furanose isomerase RbsD